MRGKQFPKTFQRVLALIVVLTVAALPVFGQAVNSASIHGLVTDPSGAVVSGAAIKVTQVSTGLVRTTTTGTDGSYSVPNLPVGQYKVEISSQGYRTYAQNGMTLQVGDSPKIDVKLAVGSASEVVDVQSDAEMVHTSESSLSQVIDQRRIVDLPLNGRQATQLIFLTGSASNPSLNSQDLLSSKNYANGGGGSSVAVSVAGGQETSNNYLLDGGDHNDAFSSVNLPFPFPDAIQEFSVQTSTLTARYGVHAGSAINVLTKSGSNKFHGSAFEFLRNGAVNANHYFTKPGAVDDTLKRNQFGGTLGGPIIKDKLMFFTGYQGTRNRSTPPSSQVIVPTAAALAGNFSQMESAACQSNGVARAIIDPVTKAAFPGSIVNPTRFNQQALNLLKFVPVSSDPCGKLTLAIPVTGDEDQGITRIDWQQSAKNSVFVRYFITDFNDPAFFDGQNILTTTKAGQLSRAQSLGISDTFTINPRMVNSVHVTGTRLAIFRGPADNMINFSTLGVNVPNPIPTDLVLSISGYFSVESGTSTVGHFNDNAYQVSDDFDWAVGRHQISFGVDYIHSVLNELSTFQSNGQFTFNGGTTKDGLVDFLLGLPNTFVQGNPEQENWTQNYWGFYAQDNFRLRPNLTLNAGLRWDPYLPATDRYNRGSYFDIAAFAAGTKSTVFPTAPPGLFYCGDSQVPCSFVNSRWKNFSPRVGFNWDPRGKGKETVRGGFGIFYDNPEIFYFDRFADNSPYGSGISLTSPAGGFTNPYQGQTVPAFPLPFPTATNAFFPKNGVYINVPQNLKPTYVQQWNLSLEKQVGPDWLFSASYVGNKTTHLWLGYEANPAVFLPGTCGTAACSTTANTNARRLLSQQNAANGSFFSSVTQTNDGADASYNGLLLSARHRFNQNFTVLTNYTYSHCISEGDFNGELTNSRQTQNPNAPLSAERGNCGFDIRHIFNSSLVVSSPKFHNKVAEWIAGNWQFSSIIGYRTGSKFSVFTGTDNSLSGIGKDRPNVVADPASCCGTVLKWFNTAAFLANPTGTFGNSSRNMLEGPGQLNTDMSITRQFKIRESQNLQLRFEAFNFVNHPNFNNPNSTLSNATFGQITSTGDPRILQLAVKYVF